MRVPELFRLGNARSFGHQVNALRRFREGSFGKIDRHLASG